MANARRVLAPLRPHYDYLLLDCPPSLSLLMVNALHAADGVIIPVQAEDKAVRQIEQELKLDIQAYGVGPVNGRQLGGIIAARATLIGRNGTILWKKDEWANSSTTALLDTLEANPSLWPRMINEAAEALAKKLLLVTTKTGRTIPEPFM